MIHGVTELFAIMLAGAAGFRIGRRWPSRASGPGSRPRRRGPQAAALMAGVLVMLFCAGILEGVGRQLIQVTGIRYAIAAASGLIWLTIAAAPGAPSTKVAARAHRLQTTLDLRIHPRPVSGRDRPQRGRPARPSGRRPDPAEAGAARRSAGARLPARPRRLARTGHAGGRRPAPAAGRGQRAGGGLPARCGDHRRRPRPWSDHRPGGGAHRRRAARGRRRLAVIWLLGRSSCCATPTSSCSSCAQGGDAGQAGAGPAGRGAQRRAADGGRHLRPQRHARARGLPAAELPGQPRPARSTPGSTLLGIVWCAVFVFFPLFNRDRLRVGDLVAGTWVVKAPQRKLDVDSPTPARAAFPAGALAFPRPARRLWGQGAAGAGGGAAPARQADRGRRRRAHPRQDRLDAAAPMSPTAPSSTPTISPCAAGWRAACCSAGGARTSTTAPELWFSRRPRRNRALGGDQSKIEASSAMPTPSRTPRSSE